MHKYTKKQMESIEKMLKWFQSKYKTEFKLTDEEWGRENGNDGVLIYSSGQFLVNWMKLKLNQSEYNDAEKVLWNAIRELYVDNHKDGNAYMITQILRK
jgi:hypothetical protein